MMRGVDNLSCLLNPLKLIYQLDCDVISTQYTAFDTALAEDILTRSAENLPEIPK